MLQELHIQNYAIIDELVISFHGGLNIITGETGAGKSILMGALSLILGERADSNVVLNKEKKCFVEGVFHASGKHAVTKFLQENDLDVNDELVIRREIAVSGKSRAFVNDTPVTLNQLQELSGKLVDLHRQFDTVSLGESGFQMAVIDAMAGNEAVLQKYRKAYKGWLEINNKLAILTERRSRETREMDYHQFLFNELEEAALKENELENLESELELLNNAEGIKAALSNIYEQLLGQDKPTVQLMKQLLQQLQPYTSQHPQMGELATRLQAVYVELDDVASEAGRLQDKIGFEAARIEQINDRLNTGYRLLKKHSVKSTASLLEIMDELSAKLSDVEQLGDSINQLEKERQQVADEMFQHAQVLSIARKKLIQSFEKQVNDLLTRVGMPNARIKVQLETADAGMNGTDTIDFLFDANKSNQFSPIRKVASGGELSRLMLCIKSLVAGKMDLPTLIFDEIDSGISGEASRQVALIMKELSAARQILCITHQPQIAGKADQHLLVYKDNAAKAVRTRIRVLAEEERIRAIAIMLGGDKPSTAAMDNAREMMVN
ncbi:DNA repair protein RecN [Flavihumibacter sp. ZG627]|uniref:DNA repair protein RecN n=1 Tax=Flavihumibacter sp. ZG627 TaxID=1463156 RepID=UPI00057FC32E|nr:DNA repair protein RecN [Flavihumibacter sp. ZG627]KIC90456.1 DNA recombination protein RecN [Flavihumibacter sp. ZG627]